MQLLFVVLHKKDKRKKEREREREKGHPADWLISSPRVSIRSLSHPAHTLGIL